MSTARSLIFQMAADDKKAEDEQAASQPKVPQPEKLYGTLGMLPHYYRPLSGIMRPSAEDEPDKDEQSASHPKSSPLPEIKYASDDPQIPYYPEQGSFPVSILKSINSGGRLPSSEDEPDKDEKP